MTWIDWSVLIGYFVVMAGIGFWSMLKIKKQEDFFLGGRSFGKVLQAFAAFGAGTGSNDPVLLGRTTYVSGLSGIWGVLLWLFVTPFYWIFGVWYRRMRHLTLGDWFVERYESKSLGAAYTLFAIYFYIMYLSVAFAAVGKVCTPLIGAETFNLPMFGPTPIFYVLLPVIALVVMVYGALGGLRAAYWTDLIQGVFIILLSVLLIPYGLNALVDRYEPNSGAGTVEGFRIMHEQVAPEYFEITDSPRGGEFPLYYIAAITLINLVGIVVQPHFIATGGGSAKSEMSARTGLVVGNFMKRFCTVGWALTGLIVLALLADNLEIAEDPDRVWGVAARKILGPMNLGLVGLMLACLLAALMSSADCYMLVTSALVVRNLYAPYVNPNASEAAYIRVGRLVSVAIIGGATVVAMLYQNVFEQMKVTWEITAIFAATFWVGMFWRRGTKWAAWGTVIFTTLTFIVLPKALPMLKSDLPTDQTFAKTNAVTVTTVLRKATAADAARRKADIEAWEEKKNAKLSAAHFAGENQAGQDTFSPPNAAEEKAISDKVLAEIGPRPKPLAAGDEFSDTFRSGGKAIYWTGGVKPIDDNHGVRQTVKVELKDQGFRVIRDVDGQTEANWYNGRLASTFKEANLPSNVVDIARTIKRGEATIVQQETTGRMEGQGDFNLDFLLYDWLGLNLRSMSDPMLETLRLPPRIVSPFLVMILLSLITPRNSKQSLDRYYVKMKTPVAPNPETDVEEMEKSYADPARFDDKRLVRFGGLEFQTPSVSDVVGVVLSFVACFGIIALAVWVAKIGS